MITRIRIGIAASWLLTGAILAHAQSQATPPQVTSEEIEPRTIGTTGTTMIGLAGYVDGLSSSERALPTNYWAQLDVGRFIARHIVVRGGVAGTGRLRGDDSEDLPAGVGAPALHAVAGALYYFTPLSMVSLFAGGEYWAQLTRRAAGDRGWVVGAAGLQGAMSSRTSVFLEGGYGMGLTKGDEGETLSRFVARVGIRLKF
jgi:hypothetical protein